jgi:hypothetical protein
MDSAEENAMDTRSALHGFACGLGPGSCQRSGPRGSAHAGALLVSTFFAAASRREVRPLRERPARPPRA